MKKISLILFSVFSLLSVNILADKFIIKIKEKDDNDYKIFKSVFYSNKNGVEKKAQTSIFRIVRFYETGSLHGDGDPVQGKRLLIFFDQLRNQFPHKVIPEAYIPASLWRVSTEQVTVTRQNDSDLYKFLQLINSRLILF
jgi:hypothetical protein